MKPRATIPASPRACIACGGTGGHLFPGIAVARELIGRGCEVALMISQKEIDQEAVRNLEGVRIVTLPAVGLTRGARLAFLRGFVKSYLASKRFFKDFSPALALAMGGFTSAPPLLAARARGAATFLHESNSVPGRANRWLSRTVDKAFIGFPSAAGRLHCRDVQVTGTPVRSEFFSLDPARCRTALGLDPLRPVVLVMGGSQGAEGINRLVVDSLPVISRQLPGCQWLHVAGPGNTARVEEAFRANSIAASVHGFLPAMDLALGAATATISRAGASSLAELAAARLPAILIPFPAATDNHQYYNARAFHDAGAARLLQQSESNPAALGSLLVPLVKDDAAREEMKSKLAAWSAPGSAGLIAETMLQAAGFNFENAQPGKAGLTKHASPTGGPDRHPLASAAEVTA